MNDESLNLILLNESTNENDICLKTKPQNEDEIEHHTLIEDESLIPFEAPKDEEDDEESLSVDAATDTNNDDDDDDHSKSLIIQQLEEKNKKLEATLENIYEKDDLFMSSSRRQNSEKETLLSLLRSDIEKLTEERDAFHLENQNLMSIVSKALLINSSVEDHINRRLNRIISPHQGEEEDDKETKSASSTATTTSTCEEDNDDKQKHCNDTHSDNESLSDEGLDISQRIVSESTTTTTTTALSTITDDTIIEASVKLQGNIDKILNMFEETKKQLIESNSLQIELADNFEMCKDQLDDLKMKYSKMEIEKDEQLTELKRSVVNYQGLYDAYEKEIQNKKETIEQLESNLANNAQMLKEANAKIEMERNETSNLEVVRKDLEAQRSLFTAEMKDSDIKGTFFFSFLFYKFEFKFLVLFQLF
jgi:hypothetical protein